jgi:hypothetical protein
MNTTVTAFGSAALQQNRDTIRLPVRRMLWTEQPPWPKPPNSPTPRQPVMTEPKPKPRLLLIKGTTLDGAAFRPSDWSERLAGAMSSFRPAGAATGIGAFIGYSPYCVPRTIDGVRCVLVSEALRGIEPMAWDFVVNFARDNRLQVDDASDLKITARDS